LFCVLCHVLCCVLFSMLLYVLLRVLLRVLLCCCAAVRAEPHATSVLGILVVSGVKKHRGCVLLHVLLRVLLHVLLLLLLV